MPPLVSIVNEMKKVVSFNPQIIVSNKFRSILNTSKFLHAILDANFRFKIYNSSEPLLD